MGLLDGVLEVAVEVSTVRPDFLRVVPLLLSAEAGCDLEVEVEVVWNCRLVDCHWVGPPPGGTPPPVGLPPGPPPGGTPPPVGLPPGPLLPEGALPAGSFVKYPRNFNGSIPGWYSAGIAPEVCVVPMK